MSGIAVVHLVWKPLGTKPFAEFVESYKRRRGGLAHDLVVVFNGFKDRNEAKQYLELLGELEYEPLFIFPSTQDIPAYFTAARAFTHNYFCFLNSYSVILDDEWLAKMHAHISRPDVGIVGASGSWESYLTNLSSPPPSSTSRFWIRRRYQNAAIGFQRRRELRSITEHFDPFPNYHVRTTGFMLARETMLGLKAGRLRSKMDCFRFESGKNNLTRQILEMGLDALVVGSNGVGYRKEEWRTSQTFRTGAQSNLLISDNHTRLYSEAEAPLKELLERLSWGVDK